MINSETTTKIKKGGKNQPVTLEQMEQLFNLHDKNITDVFRKEIEELALSIGKNFNLIDERFDAIDERFKAIDERFDKVDQRFRRIDVKLSGMDSRIRGLNSRMDDFAENYVRK